MESVLNWVYSVDELKRKVERMRRMRGKEKTKRNVGKKRVLTKGKTRLDIIMMESRVSGC
jgi:hypothetical protein